MTPLTLTAAALPLASTTEAGADEMVGASAYARGGLARVVGPVCAAATGALIGKPEAYSCARAYEKTMGLNLKERSSGTLEGQLRITKRGPGQVRHLRYLAALRFLKEESGLARAWYSARKSREGGPSLKAVMAVMRKLARALWHVGRGASFDVTKLFDGRRLGPEATCAPALSA